jgi:G:T-mismatch repair DNA endonuclease (very short patch repair protein)
MRTRKCQFCYKTITNARHIYYCNSRSTPLSNENIRAGYIQYNFPTLTKEKLHEEYVVNVLSLPDLKKKYGIDYKSCQFLLRFFSIHLRTASESARSITKIKGEQTCLKKYGLKSTANKGGLCYIGRKKTLKEKYNVENSFQIPAVKKQLSSDEFWFKRFGVDLKTLRSIGSKRAWSRKTVVERNDWLKRSTLSGHSVSKLENNIGKTLMELGYKIITQFCIFINKRTYVYDFFLPAYNLIIEVNGDYWHANPVKYLKDDVLSVVKKTAEEIWKLDEIKINIARNSNYNIFVLWENDICKNIKNINKYLERKINEYRKN